MLANDLDYETAFSFIWFVLNIALAAFYGCVLVTDITQASLKDRKQGLSITITDKAFREGHQTARTLL